MTPPLSRCVLVVVEPLPLGEIEDLMEIAERTFGRPARELVCDGEMARKFGAVMVIRPRGGSRG